MEKVFIIDESIVTTLRNAGYTCELDNTNVVSFNFNPNRPWPPQNVPDGDWYATDCPLDPHKPVAGIVLFGTFAVTIDGRERILEQAEAAYREWIK